MPADSKSITARLANRSDEDVLVVTSEEELTAAQCRARVNAAASGLRELGVRAGDRVATLQPLSIDALVTWWSLDRLGAVYLPLNPTWTPRLAARVLTDRRPSLLLAEQSMRVLAEDAVAGAGGLDLSIEVPPAGRGKVPTAEGVPDLPEFVERDAQQDCCIIHNSGLPGIHHGVRGSWQMFAVMGSAMAAAHPDDRVLIAASPCFMGTLLSIYGAVAWTGSVALLPDLTAETFWPRIRSSGVTFAALLNPSLADLLARPVDPHDHHHPLRLIAANPAQIQLNERGFERFGFHWTAGLGKTEVCGAVSTDLDPTPADGVGRVRAPFIGRVVDPAGNGVADGESGELRLRCSVPGGLPLGYADDQQASEALWPDGWMRTGWHVNRDGAGNLHPVGNLSIDPIIVKRAGYLFAADLENEIVAIGTGVTGARVADRPGERPTDDPIVTAWVTGQLDRQQLTASLRAGLPAHLVPDFVVPVRVLPRHPDADELPSDAWAIGS